MRVYTRIISAFFLLLFTVGRAAPGNLNLHFDFNKTNISPYLHPPFISAVINDSTDPARFTGISLLIKNGKDNVPAAQYEISTETTNSAVAAEKDIRIQKHDGYATLFIQPSGVGYADITLTLSSQHITKTLVINYAVSAALSSTINTTWHTGSADASAAIAINNQYMLVADDELSHLYLFNRHQSGLPVADFFYADRLDLTDGVAPFYKEVDVEACAPSTRFPGRTYWIGSMSNSANFNYKPNRNHVFAVDVKDTGSKTNMSCMGECDDLRQQLTRWGDDNGYKFGKAAHEGENPKATDGFNIEGAAFAPDSTTLFIGFRAPLVPLSDRKNAVIAPIKNFENWFGNGRQKGRPDIGKPIELYLGGRGIRDMIRLSNGVYIIVAGSADEVVNGAIYRWSGNASDSAVQLTGFSIEGLKTEVVLEVDDAEGNLVPNALQVISDNGSTVFYNDNIPAKMLANANFKKFRSDIIYAKEAVLDKNWNIKIIP